MFDSWRGFETSSLSPEWHKKLQLLANNCRGDILKMTTLAASGHPGGSMSSIDIYATLYNLANIDPKQPKRDDRDRIIISHGHTSPGAYSALARSGFFNIDDCITGFRKAGSPFEGHVEQSVPGIEWDTGNLGQGLAVGIGKAIYAKQSKKNFHTFVLMGDGEQQKGQISESRRIAVKYNLKNLTTIIDYNQLQISGDILNVMPQNISAEWKADGWEVLGIDGHNLNQIYDALYQAIHKIDKPVMILASTVMGKGVSFMENKEAYHGAPLKEDQLEVALKELNIENNYESYKDKRKKFVAPDYNIEKVSYPEVDLGQPITYQVDEKTDCRSAFGNALVSFADANINNDSFVVSVFDCDLAASVKTSGIEKKYPDNFFQFGISEHSTATAAGALSAEKAISIWADFGVFGITETYNQARLNDINHANMKIFNTHCGINVGEDGKTHQCIDYFGLLNSTFGWKIITPADPNQTDRIVRYVLSNSGNFAVVMGRSKILTIPDENNKPFFGDDYQYKYGQIDKIRDGKDVVIAAAGNMMANVFEAWKILSNAGIQIKLVSISDWTDISDDDLEYLASEKYLITVEDHNIKTGLGNWIGSKLFDKGLKTKLVKMGIRDYAPSGNADDLYRLLGLDANAIVETVKNLL
ncbi:MAG: transketolase [Candidatus Zixiibacteriota bacterium]|nr:MAG: transketolase [candidate division Zixibacteria bacterium]